MITFGKKVAEPATGAAPAVQTAPAPQPPVPPVSEESAVWRVLPLEGTFRFSYLDASGRPSLRRLSASELKVGPGKLLLGGVDADLEAYRGFRVDRIHSLQTTDTGEIVDRNILDWLLDLAARQAREKAARDRGRGGPALQARRRNGRSTSLAAA